MFVCVPGPLLGRQASTPAVIDTNSAYMPYQDTPDSEIQQGLYGVQESVELSEEDSATVSQKSRMEDHRTRQV